MIDSKEKLFDAVFDCIHDEEVSVSEIYDKILEASSYAFEYHNSCKQKSQKLFDLLRGNSHDS